MSEDVQKLDRRPDCIPEHAENVTFFGHLWLWEFAGGAILYLVHEGQAMEPIRLTGDALSGLVWWFGAEAERYNAAIKTEAERQAVYEAYLSGVDYEPDESDL